MEGVILADGSQAIDVDNRRTYAVVEQLLGQRSASPDTLRTDPDRAATQRGAR